MYSAARATAKWRFLTNLAAAYLLLAQVNVRLKLRSTFRTTKWFAEYQYPCGQQRRKGDE